MPNGNSPRSTTTSAFPDRSRGRTQTGRSQTGRSQTAGAWRVAAAAVLLAVTVIGIRAHGAFSRAPDLAAAGATGTVLAITLAACEGVALVAFVIVLASARPRRVQPDTAEPERLPFPWWAKPLGVLLAVAMLAVPFVVLFTKVRKKTSSVPSLAHHGSPVSGSQKLTAAAPGSAWPLLAGMVIAIAVVLTLALLARRKRPAAQPRDRDSQAAAVAEALAAGRAALAASREPRAAIIACYAAMEHGFAAAGSAPAAADTPAEVLARATGAGLVRPAAAEVLTGLFRRARYSAEPVIAADAAAAAGALAQMQADLADREGRSDLAAAGARP